MGLDDIGPSLDREALDAPVRALLGCPTAEILNWEAKPIGYAHINNSTGGILRVSGRARVREGSTAWSLVLKILQAPAETWVQRAAEVLGWSPEEAALYREGWLWDREARAYSSLLADLRGRLRAPACFGVAQPSAHARWLWLEDVGDADEHAWSLDTFAEAARALGSFNGAYLVERSLPSASWLNRRWLRIWSTTSVPVAIRLIRRPDTWEQPAIRRAFPIPAAERLLRLSGEVAELLDVLDRLPRTLCHHDAFRPNLLVRRAGPGAAFRAVDWGFMGTGAIGEDAGQLLGASLLWNVADPARAADLEDAIFEGYLDGLRDSGWAGDFNLARRGFALAAVVRWGIHAPRLYEAPGSSRTSSPPGMTGAPSTRSSPSAPR